MYTNPAHIRLYSLELLIPPYNTIKLPDKRHLNSITSVLYYILCIDEIQYVGNT